MVGITAIICAVFVIPLSLAVSVLGLSTFLAVIIFGVWWGVLEVVRWQEQNELNRPYEEEMAERRLAVQQQQEAWERQLAVQRDQAAQQHRVDEARWQAMIRLLSAEAEVRRRAEQEARHRLDAAEQNRASAAAWFFSAFERKKGELQKLRDRHAGLTTEYARDRQQLQARARELQLCQFLQQQFISDHEIPGIGAARKATLASFGIETAFDIVEDRILEIRGFSHTLTERLIEWRLAVEKQFFIDTTAGIPLSEQQALDARYVQVRQPVETGLSSGAADLRAIVQQAEGDLRKHDQYIEWCVGQLAQAMSDLAVVPLGL